MKPFPSKVNWLAVWRHRWTILNFVNQVAHGSFGDAEHVMQYYGGHKGLGREFYRAARECIEVRK